jgi:hypothetical protein
LFADTYGIVATWRKYFSQLFNVYGVNDVRHTEIHTAESKVPDRSAFAVEMVNRKNKKLEINIDQIPTV